MYSEVTIVAGSDGGVSSLASAFVGTGLFSEESRSGTGTGTVVWLQYRGSTDFYLKVYNSTYVYAKVYKADKTTAITSLSYRMSTGSPVKIYTNGYSVCIMCKDSYNLCVTGFTHGTTKYLGEGMLFYDGTETWYADYSWDEYVQKTVSGKTILSPVHLMNSATNLLQDTAVDCLRYFSNPDGFSGNAPITDGTSYYSKMFSSNTSDTADCLFKYTLT